ncbi:CsbD family protein [Streptomyces lavendulocolor]|uniref:CsbD family protein n=1 Tax=Streptomyces lavendulocolor TaxID=67316 RepID=UPI003F4CCC6D
MFRIGAPPLRATAQEVTHMAAGKKAKNVARSAKGKAKEATGRAAGNESLEAEGRAEQMKSDAKQTVQKGKDTLKH